MRWTRIVGVAISAAVLGGLATVPALAQDTTDLDQAVIGALQADSEQAQGTATDAGTEALERLRSRAAEVERIVSDLEAHREYLADAVGSEIRGTTGAGTPFPRAIVAGYAARGDLPWWLGADADYWLSPSLEGYDRALREARTPATSRPVAPDA